MLSPDAKRALLAVLESGALDPHDTLSAGELDEIRYLCEPDHFTYRLFVDFEMHSHETPDEDQLNEQAHQVLVGLRDSDAFPDPTDAAFDSTVTYLGWGVCLPSDGCTAPAIPMGA